MNEVGEGAMYRGASSPPSVYVHTTDCAVLEDPNSVATGVKVSGVDEASVSFVMVAIAEEKMVNAEPVHATVMVRSCVGGAQSVVNVRPNVDEARGTRPPAGRPLTVIGEAAPR
jgi:hypothetical protein